jgi:hypothetical protein
MMPLDEILPPRPQVDLGPPEWTEHLRIAGVPPGFLAPADLPPPDRTWGPS